MKFLRVQRREFGKWPTKVQEELARATMGSVGMMRRTAAGSPTISTMVIFLRDPKGKKTVASWCLLRDDEDIMMYTLPEHRRKGLAARLLRYLIRNKKKKQTLRGWIGRVDAQGLYQEAIKKKQIEEFYD